MSVNAQSETGSDPSIAIIGAGFSGLAMAYQLRQRGFENFTIFEKADEVGGTWRENTYPGVACDVPSHLYSFSFDQNPRWSERFSQGGEIQDYVRESARRLDLYPQIRFSKTATRASHDGKGWHISFADGETAHAEILISGLGGLHVPNVPDIAGQDSFSGHRFHTARWDHKVSLTGKRVAIIGSAASAVQVVPSIAPQVSRLDVYQRTPNWILPRGNYRYPDWVKSALGAFPSVQALYRQFIFNLLDLRFPAFKDKDHWMKRHVERRFRAHLDAHINDPELRAKVMPDYPLGCKRVLISDDFYPALAQPHVHLITEPIAAINDTGVVSGNDAQRDVDVIVYATGFKTFELMDALDVTNADGFNLREAWADGIAAHKTLSIPKFPDFFMLLGPNSALGHNSVVLMIEAQTKYIGALLEARRRHGLTNLHPDRFAAQQYDDRLQSQLGDRVWAGGCKSWYLDDNGRNYTLYPDSVRAYFRDLKAPDLREYEFERVSGGNQAP